MKTIMFWALATVLMITPGWLSAADARKDVHATAEDAQPLMPGMLAPGFDVRDVLGEPFRFDPAHMEKPLVLTFYRGGWCPFCNLHLSEMRHAETALIEMGFDIWFVSIDLPEVLAQSLDEPDLGYTLLSDSRLHATRAFGIAFTVDDETHQRYLTHSIDIEAASGETHHVLPVPSTYIIGTDGVISFQYTNIDYRVRLHPDVLLAAARAYTEDADKRLRNLRAKRREAKSK
jgi:peroxiredoxin